MRHCCHRQDDIARLSSILQAPGDLTYKQQQIREELETRIVETLEAGSEVEETVFQRLKGRLPENVVKVIEDLRGSQGSAGNVPVGVVTEIPPSSLPARDATPVRPLTSDDVNVNIAAGELQQLTSTVGELREALEVSVGNEVQANKAMLRMNLQDLRDRLAKELDELQPGVTSQKTIGGAPVSAAVDEARALLADTDAFLNSL